MFIDELTELQERKKLNMNLFLNKFEKGWVGPYGKLTEDHIRDYMPPANDDTNIILSGSKSQLNEITPILNEIGYRQIVLPRSH
jgi:hypothetical protein